MNIFDKLFNIKICLRAVCITIVSSLLITLPLSAISDTGACVRAYVANRFPLEAIYNSNHESNTKINIRNHLPTPVTAWIVGPQGELFYSKTIDGYIDVTSSSSSCMGLKPCQAAIDGIESRITGFSNGTDAGNNGQMPVGSNYLWLITDTLSGAVIDARVMASSMNLQKISKSEQNVVNYCLAPIDLGHGRTGHYEPGKKNVWHITGAALPPPNSIGPPPVSSIQSPVPNQGGKFLTGGSYLGSYKEEISTMGKKDPTIFDKTKRQHFLMHYQSWYLSSATISLLPGETRQYIEEISRGIQGEVDLSFQYSASLGLSAEIPLGDVPLGGTINSGWSFGADFSISAELEITTINQRKICNPTKYPVTFLQWQIMDTYTIWKYVDKDSSDDYSNNYGYKISSTISSIQSAVLTTVLWTDNNGKKQIFNNESNKYSFTCDITRISE